MTVENKHTIYIDRCIELINKTVSIRFSSTFPSRLEEISFLYHILVLTVLTRVGVVAKTFCFPFKEKLQNCLVDSYLFFRFLKKLLLTIYFPMCIYTICIIEWTWSMFSLMCVFMLFCILNDIFFYLDSDKKTGPSLSFHRMARSWCTRQRKFSEIS